MFKDIYLQWFAEADPGVPDIEFEEEGEGDEEEIEIVEEGAEEVIDPNAPKPKTPAEYEAEIAALKASADPNVALRGAIQELGEKLGGSRQAALPPAALPALVDDSAEMAKFNVDVFAENPYGTIKPMIEKIAREIAKNQVNQVAGAFGGTLAQNQKRMLKMDPVEGTLFTEYEKEIEEEAQRLIIQNPAVQSNPELYQYAFSQVKMRNIDAIAQKRADEIIATRDVKPKTKIQFSERATGTASQKPRTKKVVITKREERLCNLRGLPLKQFGRMKAEGGSFNVGGELVYE